MKWNGFGDDQVELLGILIFIFDLMLDINLTVISLKRFSNYKSEL
jgi:hypothetical protein